MQFLDVSGLCDGDVGYLSLDQFQLILIFLIADFFSLKSLLNGSIFDSIFLFGDSELSSKLVDGSLHSLFSNFLGLELLLQD